MHQAQDYLTEAQTQHQKLTQQRNAVLRTQAEAQAHALETRHRLVNRQSRLEQAGRRLQELDSQLQELQDTVETGTERHRAQQRLVEIARWKQPWAPSCRMWLQSPGTMPRQRSSG